MKTTLILSIMMCASSHPIAMITVLISTTIFISYNLLFILKNSWVSLIFMLILLGGMLVLFIYMASLASNETFKKNKIFMTAPLAIFLPMLTQPYSSNFLENSLYLLFNSQSSLNSHLAVFYLLLALLVVMEMISCYKSPLRSKL